MTLVDDDQLVTLAETEFNYAIRRLDGARFSGRQIDYQAPIAFVSRHGALGIDGEPRHAGATAASARCSSACATTWRPARTSRSSSSPTCATRSARSPSPRELRQRKLPFEHPETTVLDV